jgi:hypothetical protein
MKATNEQILGIIEENNSTGSNLGICLSCGNQQDGCEPDARNYECESCGTRQVFGAEEALMMISEV